MATRKTVPAAAKAVAKGGLLAKISSFVRFGPFTRESKMGLGVVAAVLVLYAAYLWFLQQSGKKKGALPCACGRLGSCVVCSPLLPLLPLPRPTASRAQGQGRRRQAPCLAQARQVPCSQEGPRSRRRFVLSCGRQVLFASLRDSTNEVQDAVQEDQVK